MNWEMLQAVPNGQLLDLAQTSEYAYNKVALPLLCFNSSDEPELFPNFGGRGDRMQVLDAEPTATNK